MLVVQKQPATQIKCGQRSENTSRTEDPGGSEGSGMDAQDVFFHESAVDARRALPEAKRVRRGT